jgi:hypothetical protein
MRDDFCAFILSHGRPERVHTFKTLQRSGYTGKIFIVIDDEDRTAEEYKKRYGEKVLTFSREEAFKITDDGDNFGKSKGVVYARNVCWDLARNAGVRYFVVLDDDYHKFEYRYRADRSGFSHVVYKTLDDALSAMVAFLDGTSTTCIAMGQGGDLIGGTSFRPIALMRKAMNVFVCSADRPFAFMGHINEDVNAYVLHSRCGKLLFTTMQVTATQARTQAIPGGLTEFYLDVGTYVKSFYSVMYAPSCVKISTFGDPRSGNYRIHHKINWGNTAPKILREEHKKATCQSVTPV